MENLTDLLGDFNEQDTSSEKFLSSIIEQGELKLSSSLKDVVDSVKPPSKKAKTFITNKYIKDKKQTVLKSSVKQIKAEDSKISADVKSFLDELSDSKQTKQLSDAKKAISKTKSKVSVKDFVEATVKSNEKPLQNELRSGLKNKEEQTEQQKQSSNNNDILKDNDLSLETKQEKPAKDRKYTLKNLPFEKDYLVSTKDIINKEQLLDILQDTYFTYLDKYSQFNLFAPKERGMMSSLGRLLFKIVSKFISGLFMKPLKWLAKGGMKLFKGGLSKAWGYIKSGLDWIVGKLKGFFSKIGEFVSNVLGKIKAFIKGIGEKLGNFFKGAWNKIRDVFRWVSDKFNKLFGAVKEKWSAFKNYFGKIGSKFAEKFKQLKDGLSGLKNAISKKISGIVDAWKSFKAGWIKRWEKVKGFVNKGIEKTKVLVDKTKNISKTAVNKTKAFVNKAKPAFTKAKAFVSKFLPNKAGGGLLKKYGGKLLPVGGKAAVLYAKVDAAVKIGSGGVQAAKDLKELGLSGTVEKYDQEVKNMSIGDMFQLKNVMKAPWIMEELTTRALKKIQPEKVFRNISDKITNKLKDVRDATICSGCAIRLELEQLKKKQQEQQTRAENTMICYKEDGQSLPFSNFQFVQGG